MIGKGVCFDSGGISIKPADRMEEMKTDKTGACTVIAAIATIKQLAPDLPIMAVAPAVENMPGPHSTRPGDVVKAHERQDGRDHQHRRRGPAHPGRRVHLGGAERRHPPGGRGHPDGRRGSAPSATRSPAASRPPRSGGTRSPRRAPARPSATGRSRSSPTTARTWTRPTPTSRTAARPRHRSSRAACSWREFVTKPWAHLDIAGSAYFRKAHPWAARGATGVSHATLVELALGGA